MNYNEKKHENFAVIDDNNIKSVNEKDEIKSTKEKRAFSLIKKLSN